MRHRAALLGASAVLLSLGPIPAEANPQGGTVRGGAATIATPAPGRTEINQTSDRVIIDWNGFSIGAGEITRFTQPSASAAALNRVTGADPSQILGQLSANGRVLLINPNGILFGAGSKVDVAGLVATTSNLGNDDFMARRLAFTMPGAPGAAVVNRGTITVQQGGVVALVAAGVANEGVITARLGKVSLVSAERFTVDFHGDRLIQFALNDKVAPIAVAPDGAALGAAVSNSGRIAANGGTVQMSANGARGVLDNAIDMSGVVQARTVRKVNGRILLDGGDGTVQVAGILDASGRRAGQTGGTVKISGERVGLFAGTNIDASGDAGGGTVLVGGNRQGQGPERNAQATYVDRAATIKADAVSRGDGGQVVVWSDAYTRFDGAISARGGASGGVGGAVETSSHGNLQVGTGRVDAAAPKGRAGEWLLDPYDVTITNTLSNGTFAGGVFTATGNNAQVDAGAISTALSAGTSVTVSTNGAGGQNGDLTVAANITKTGGGAATLTLTVDGAIGVTGAPVIGVAGGASLDVSMTLGNAGTLPGLSLGTGALTVNSSGAHLFQGGAITQSAGGGAVTIDLNVHGLDLNNAGNLITGALSILNAAGSGTTVVNTGPLTLAAWSLSGGASPVSITASGGITQTGAMTQAAGGSPVTLNAGAGAIALTNAGNSITGTLSLNNTGANNVAAVNTVPTTFATSSIGGNLTFSTAGAIDQSGGLTVGGTASVTTGASPITLNHAGNSIAGAVSLTNSGANNVQLVNSAATVLGSSTIGRNLIVTTAGALTQTGVLTVGGTTALAASAAGIDLLLDTQANNLTGVVSVAGTPANVRDLGLRNVSAGATVPVLTGLTNLRNLNLSFDNAGMALGGVTATGTMTLTAGGAVTQTASATVIGATSVTAGANAITLTQAANSLRGAVALSNSGANDASLVNNRATLLGTVTVGRNLAVTAVGAVTQSAAATVGGTTTVAAGANAIGLTQGANNFGGAVTLSNSGSANAVAITTGGALNVASITAGGGVTINAAGGTSLASSIATGGAISVTGALALGGGVTLDTTAAAATGNAITLGAVTGAGQTLTLNAGSSGDISLTTVGAAGTPLGALTITTARNVTGSGLVAVGSLTQSAGTGATNFGTAGVSASGAATLTASSVAGMFNVGSFTVTSGSTVVTGSIGGVTGAAAAALAGAPGSTGIQTFNGCTIGTSCAAAPAVTVAQAGLATNATRQVLGALSSNSAPSQDPNGSSNVQGFEVQIPTQNVDWSNPSGDLSVTLAPELGALDQYFRGGQASRALTPFLHGGPTTR